MVSTINLGWYRTPISFRGVKTGLVATFLLLLVGAVGSISAATLNLLPGEIEMWNDVQVSGTGFQPGEIVLLGQTWYSGEIILDEINQVVSATADGQGSIQVVISYNGTITIPSLVEVMATGSSSGFEASATLENSNTILQLTSPDGPLCLDTITPATTIELCAQLFQVCLDGSLAPLEGREIIFFVADGNCGVSVGQSDDLLAVTDADGIACFTLGRLDTLILSAEISFRAKFRGEHKPGDTEPANSACSDDRLTLAGSNDCMTFPVVVGCVEGETDFDISTSGAADLYFVRTADIDRDNYVDVVYTGSQTTGLFISYGNSDGILDPPINYLPISLAAFDFGYLNDDTLLDIVAIQDADVYFLLNNGDRTFEISSTTSPGNGGPARTSIPSINTGYFNADHFADIVEAPDQLRLGSADGDFSNVITLPFSFEAAGVADFNSDGIDDLFLLGADSIFIRLNDGSANFVLAYSASIPAYLLDIPPAIALSDLNRDGATDMAMVLPLADSSGESLIITGLGDNLGHLTSLTFTTVTGIAYNVNAEDVNRDNTLDLIIANGSSGNLEIYLGDSTGGFASPELVPLGFSDGPTYTLASLDLDRDGNIDFVAGQLGGGSLFLAINQETDEPVLFDEMSTTAFSNIDHTVIDPGGYVISSNFQTVAGAEYQRLDLEGNDTLDVRTLNYNLQYGEYTIIYYFNRSASKIIGVLSAAIGIDGSQQAINYLDYDLESGARAVDSLVFYYTVEDTSSIQPPNGIPTALSRPTLDWSRLVSELPVGTTYQLQLDRWYDFRSPIYDEVGLTDPNFPVPVPLGADSVFYWRFRSLDGGVWSEYSRTFALYITGICCIGHLGNLDGDPEGNVDISDLTILVDYLFMGGQIELCDTVVDANADGEISIIDVVYMVEYMFYEGVEPDYCP